MQLCRQLLPAVKLVRQVPLVVGLVVSRVLVESQACRDPRRNRSAAAYSYSSRPRLVETQEEAEAAAMSKTLPAVVWWCVVVL